MENIITYPIPNIPPPPYQFIDPEIKNNFSSSHEHNSPPIIHEMKNNNPTLIQHNLASLFESSVTLEYTYGYTRNQHKKIKTNSCNSCDCGKCGCCNFISKLFSKWVWRCCMYSMPNRSHCYCCFYSICCCFDDKKN